MITLLEAATAAAMYWSDRLLAAEPQGTAAAVKTEQCSRYHEGEQIKQCLDLKMRTLQQPDGDMWDPDWINESAAAANPNDGAKTGGRGKKATPKKSPKNG